MADDTGYSAQNAFDAAQQNFRQTQAYNALAKQYGPIAGNPELATQTAEAQTNMLAAPQVQAANQARADALQANIAQNGASLGGNPEAAQATQQAIETQRTNQGLAGYKAMQYLTSTAGADGSVNPDAVKSVIGAHPENLGLTPEQVATISSRAAQPGGAKFLSDFSQTLLGPGKVTGMPLIGTDASGHTVVKQATSTGQVRTLDTGDFTPVQQQNATTHAAMVPIAASNAASHATQAGAAAYTAGLGGIGGANLSGVPAQGVAPAAASGPGVAPVPRRGMSVLPYSDGSGYAQVPTSSVPKSAAGQQNVVDKTSGQIGQRTVQMSQSPQATAIARADLGQMDLQYKRTNDVLNKMASQVGPLTTGYGGRVSEALGTPARAALDASLQTAKSNIALLTANMARNGGKSAPVAVRNLQEFKAYQDALGAINPNASASDVRQQILTAQQNLGALHAGVHAKYAATYGNGATAQGGTPAGWTIKAVP